MFQRKVMILITKDEKFRKKFRKKTKIPKFRNYNIGSELQLLVPPDNSLPTATNMTNTIQLIRNQYSDDQWAYIVI